MTICLTINSSNGNNNYHSRYRGSPFSEIINISALDRAILCKIGFERHLNIAKRVLLLQSKPGLYLQLHMNAILKIWEIDMTS